MVTIDLSGKTALVTGGGEGIGKVICQVLSQAGANIVINYLDNNKGVNRKLAEDLAAELGDNAIAITADVRNSEQVASMLDKAIERFGTLDIVINNAAVLSHRSISKMNDDAWSLVIDTNLTGVFNVCKQAANRLAESGRIVNLSSISGSIGLWGTSNYAASKAGVEGLTRVVCNELAGRKITVNAVASGVTSAGAASAIPEETKSKMLKSVTLARAGEAKEIADAVLFLCSDLASYVTGQVIHVDGGWIR